MLRPVKREIEAVAARLVAGADSPETLAGEIIQLVESLRGEREVYALVFELSPGVYTGYAPYATRAAALKAAPKIPMAQFARVGAVVPLKGTGAGDAQLAKAEELSSERGDFVTVREDAEALRRGWRGKQRDRQNHLTT